jgi:hypothetical protein
MYESPCFSIYLEAPLTMNLNSYLLFGRLRWMLHENGSGQLKGNDGANAGFSFDRWKQWDVEEEGTTGIIIYYKSG